MAMDKLLVAYDESEGGDRALAIAADLARVNPHAHVDIVYVIPIPLLDEAQMANFKEILDMMIEDGEEMVAEAQEKMGEDLHGRVDSLPFLTGANPATEIVEPVDRRFPTTFLSLATGASSGLKEYMGSVCHKVLHASKIPVLIAK